MKSNNLILLDRVIEEEAKNCSSEISAGLFFEYFCANLLLKNYDLSKEELLNGIVDGKDDGGFDAVYIFVNGLLINDSEYIQSLKGGLDIEVVIITSKHADTFEQAVINSEYSTACEFFDLSRDNNNLTCPYNETLLDKRNIFIMLYTEKIQNVRNLALNYFFVSRGDENNIGENVKAKADQLIIKTKELLSNSECSYSFLGCSSLLNLYRKPKNFNLSRILWRWQRQCCKNTI